MQVKTPGGQPRLSRLRGWKASAVTLAATALLAAGCGGLSGSGQPAATGGSLADLSTASFRKNLGRKPELPCADGTPRERLLTAEVVVIAYAARPEYREGRERWHEVEAADGAVLVDVGQVVYLRVESDEHRIGF